MVIENSLDAYRDRRCFRRNSKKLSKVVSAGRFEDCVAVAVREPSKKRHDAAGAEDVASVDYSACRAVELSLGKLHGAKDVGALLVAN